MKIERRKETKKFVPFNLVIETEKEAKHLLWYLRIPSPDMIESNKVHQSEDISKEYNHTLGHKLYSELMNELQDQGVL